MAPLRDLELMIQSRYPLIAIETFEEARLVLMIDELEKALSYSPSVDVRSSVVTRGRGRRRGAR